jgi:hypothetical protein
MSVIWLNSSINIKPVFPVVVNKILLTAVSVAIKSYTYYSIVNLLSLYVSA